MWVVIHKEILDQCDKLDAAKDSVIEDPDLCQVRAEALICGKQKTTNCLLSEQVELVNKIYTNPYVPSGSLIFPRKNPGSELGDYDLYFAGQPFSIAQACKSILIDTKRHRSKQSGYSSHGVFEARPADYCDSRRRYHR